MFYSMKLLFVVFLAKLFEVRIRFINILYPNKEINYLIKVNVSVLVVGLIVAIFNLMSFEKRINILCYLLGIYVSSTLSFTLSSISLKQMLGLDW